MNTLQKAFLLRHTAGEKIKDIQADKDLTAPAKAKRIGEIRQKANDEVAKLRTARVKEASDARDRVHRRLFGLSFKLGVSENEKQAAMSSYRDALFRADGLASPDDALRMLGRAQMIGDKLLMKAIAAVAYERGWSSVLEDYSRSSEDVADALQELQNFERRQGNRHIQFNESVVFSGITETDEERALRMLPASDDSPRAA